MDMTQSGRVGLQRIAAIGLLAWMLAGCGSGDAGRGPVNAAPPDPVPISPQSPQTPPTPQTPQPATGKLLVSMTYPDGTAASGMWVQLSRAGWSNRAVTDPDGVAAFREVPEAVNVAVTSPLGFGDWGEQGAYIYQGEVVVAQTGSTAYSVSLPYASAMAVFPASIAPADLNEDRSELDLHVVMAFPAQLDVAGFHLFLCYPTCSAQRVDAGGTPVEVRLRQTEKSVGQLPKPTAVVSSEPYSALLLLDQGRRIAEDDLGRWNFPAARNFISSARAGDQVALAGFAGSDAKPASPPLLPRLPMWIAAPFTVDRLTLKSAAADLTPMVGGSSPVLDALHEATDAIGQQGAAGQRYLVALTGGGDESGLDDSQWLIRARSLRQKQASQGIRSIIVPADSRPSWYTYSKNATGGVTEYGHSNNRRLDELARLAAMLDAPLVYSTGTPGTAAGLQFGQLAMAADLLAGRALRYEVDIRVIAASAGAFTSGSTLLLPVNLYNGLWDGYWDMNFYVVAEIP
jgi:hypothetical protein